MKDSKRKKQLRKKKLRGIKIKNKQKNDQKNPNKGDTRKLQAIFRKLVKKSNKYKLEKVLEEASIIKYL